MPTFHTELTIAATPDEIWAVLTAASAYPSWNSTVERISGEIIPGGRITVHVRQNPGRAFPLAVATWDPPRSMTWRGGMPLGLFVGERVFTIAPVGDGRQRFTMREEYRGLLAGLIGRSIPDLQPAFEQFAADLKAHLERRSA